LKFAPTHINSLVTQVRFSLSILMLLLCSFPVLHAQQIDFGDYYDSATLSSQVLQHLNFGTMIEGDTRSRELGSFDEAVIEISGLPFLDIMITFTPISFLYLDGDDSCDNSSCRISLLLNYVYTNNGMADFAPGYDIEAIPFLMSTARFPILRRVSGPPGPPPLPSIAGVSLPDPENAYIYIFGDITNTTGALLGSYRNTLTVSIVYN
jgi:hypothetical protein